MRHPLVPFVVITLACGNIGSPLLTSGEVYAFSDVVGGDTLVIHWPRSALPVRIWVATDSPIRSYVQTAIDRWQSAFLYGEFRATIVADSNTADVIVRNTPSDIGGGISAVAPQCSGETDLDPGQTAKTLRLPMHVFIYAAVSESTPGTATCYSITMTHELGHVLGLVLHSPSPGDVMYRNPSFDGISERDRLTAVTLYSIPSTVTITGRR